MASAKALEGDWQYTSEQVLGQLPNSFDFVFGQDKNYKQFQGWDPVKVTVKQMMGDQWMVACMIPKGKMMANMLKMNEPGSFSLLKFQASQKESEQEKNKILEEEFLTFMEKGITNIRKDGMIIQFQNQFKPLLCHFSYRQKLNNCGWGR